MIHLNGLTTCQCFICSFGREQKMSQIPFPLVPTVYLLSLLSHPSYRNLIDEDIYGSMLSSSIWSTLTGTNLTCLSIVTKIDSEQFAGNGDKLCTFYKKVAMWLGVAFAPFCHLTLLFPKHLVLGVGTFPLWEQVGVSYLIVALNIHMIERKMMQTNVDLTPKSHLFAEMRQIAANIACYALKAVRPDAVIVVNVLITQCVTYFVTWEPRPQEEDVYTPFHILYNGNRTNEWYHNWFSLFL